MVTMTDTPDTAAPVVEALAEVLRTGADWNTGFESKQQFRKRTAAAVVALLRSRPDLLVLLGEPNAATVEVTHACPAEGTGVTPCCGRTPFELPRTHRMALDSGLVTCGRAADLDRARRIAVALEQENAELTARAERVWALHRPSRLYDECGHKHTQADVTEGRAFYVFDVGYICEDGYFGTICHECCTRGSGYQLEECATDHTGGCWPCSTASALDAPAEPAEDAQRGRG